MVQGLQGLLPAPKASGHPNATSRHLLSASAYKSLAPFLLFCPGESSNSGNLAL